MLGFQNCCEEKTSCPWSHVWLSNSKRFWMAWFLFFPVRWKWVIRTSLAVQWLRLHAPNPGIQSLVKELNSTCRNQRSQLLLLRIHTLQLKILCAQRRVVAAARRRGRREEGKKRKERGSREERSLSPLMCGVEKEIPVSSRWMEIAWPLQIWPGRKTVPRHKIYVINQLDLILAELNFHLWVYPAVSVGLQGDTWIWARCADPKEQDQPHLCCPTVTEVYGEGCQIFQMGM